MATFEDLTTYSYSEIRGELNIGWLSKDADFRHVEPSEQFLEALWSFCKRSFQQTRGYHYCELCAEDIGRDAIYATRGDEALMLSTSEIRVFGPKSTYAAPTLIYHYVAAHHYAPPQEFTDAVMSGPRPGDAAYEAMADALNIRHTNPTSKQRAPTSPFKRI